ncbi:MAG: hypothetical protein QXU54_03235 [Candidatus Micrarchaeia archaeon]
MNKAREIRKDFAERLINTATLHFARQLPKEKVEDLMNEVPRQTGWVFERASASTFLVKRPPVLSQELDEAFYAICNISMQCMPLDKAEDAFNKIADDLVANFMSLAIGADNENARFIMRLRLKLSAFSDYLIATGFTSDCLVRFSALNVGNIRFDGFSDELWKSQHTGEFLFEKHNPALFSSNSKIYQQYGVYPAISTRALKSLLSTFMINSECLQIHMNPSGFGDGTAIEHWKIWLE